MLLPGITDTTQKQSGALFNLTRYFSITSACAIGVVTLVLTVSFYYSEKRDMTRAQEQMNVSLTQNIGNSFWPIFADYITNASEKDSKSIRGHYQTSAMHTMIESLTRGLPILKVKIYNLQGLTIYSSEQKQIGEIKKNNQALFNAAQHGTVSSSLTYKKSISTFSGEKFKRDVIESYIPIGRKPGVIEAVFEIYTDATETVLNIWHRTLLIVFGILFTLGSLYGILLTIVRRADSIMHEQFSALEYNETSIRLKNNLLERQIEERKIAEQAARDSETRFRTLFENSHDAILVIDPKLEKIINLNNKAVDLLEYSREECQALTIFDIHPQDFNEAKQFLNTIQTKGYGASSELHCLTKSGKLIPAEVSANLTKLDNEPIILVHIKDITQRIEAEKARHISEERFRDAIESLHEGFAMFDAEDNLVSYNNEYVRLHEEIKDLITPGAPYKTLLRAHVFHGVFPEAHGLEDEFIRMRLQMRRQDRFGSAIRNLENGLSYIIRENRMADGGLFVTYTDITQIQQANLQFRQVEARFRSFVEQLPFAVSIKGIESQYQLVNDSFEKWYGVKNEDIEGKTPDQVFVGQKDLVKDISEHNQSIVTSTAPSKREAKLKLPGCDERILELTKFPILGENDEMIGIGTIGNDITERKKAEETVKQSEAQFRDAVESLQEGFALFDINYCLVAFNDEFVRIHQDVAGIIQVGMRHEDLFRAIVKNGFFPEAKGREEEFIRNRMEKQRAGTFGTVLRETSKGMSYIIKESKTNHGDTVITLTDVTELRKSKERFQTLFEESNIAIYVHRNFKPLMANPATAKMYGFDSVEDFLKIESTLQLTAPEYRTDHYANYKNDKGAQTNNEHIGIKTDGSKIWVRKRTFAIDWEGEPAICSIREDITLAKEAENSLKASEERFRSAIESLQEGFALYDSNDRLVMCNDPFRDSHTHCLDVIQPGMKFEDVVRKNAYSGHNTNAEGRVEEYIEERLKKFHNPGGPIIRNSKDGTVRIISDVKMPDGSTTITQTDITEIVNAEKEVARQKTLFEAAINNAPYAFVMTNMEREIMLCNSAFVTMFGYTANEVIGKSIEILYKNNKEFKAFTHLRNLVSDHDSSDPQRVTYIRKNGETFLAEAALSPVGDLKDQVFGFISVIRDISEHVQREDETRRYQEVIANSRRLSLMGEMAAGLAHEINQPLAAIANYTEGCIQRLDNKNPEPDKLRDALKIVSEQADRAGQIINRIRGFVKKEDIKKDRLNVKDMIKEALELTRIDLERRNIVLSLQNVKSALYVTADKIQIQQVILNLIRNASDAMGSCESTRCNLTLKTTTNDDNTVEISVTDTGPGIPADELNKIFDPFFTTKSSGLGLGLNICQSIIESHGGRMWANSKKGKGATIHFTLPIAENPTTTTNHKKLRLLENERAA